MYFQRSLAEMKLTKEGRIGVWFKLQAKKFYCILLKGQIQTALFLTSKNCKKGDQIQIFSLPFTLHNRDIRLFSICHVLCSRKLELRVWRKMKNSLQQKSWYVNSSEMIKIWPYWTHRVQSIVGFNRYNLFQWFKNFRFVTSSEVFHQIFFHQWMNLCSRLYDLALNFPRRWEYGCTSLVKS